MRELDPLLHSQLRLGSCLLTPIGRRSGFRVSKRKNECNSRKPEYPTGKT